MWTHIQAKAFVGTRGGGRGGAICHNTFPNFYMFHCKKKHSFCPKLSPCSIPKGKLIPLSQYTEFQETFLRKQYYLMKLYYFFFQNHRHSHTYDRQSSFYILAPSSDWVKRSIRHLVIASPLEPLNGVDRNLPTLIVSVCSCASNKRILIKRWIWRIYDNSPTDTWPTRRFSDSVFSPTADSPTRPLTDTTITDKIKTKIKIKIRNSPTHLPTLTDSYYSWKMNERKSFCQPQSQFIRQSREKIPRFGILFCFRHHFDVSNC